MTTVLITGANRGLGLEFTRQYAAAGWQVLACCRDVSSFPQEALSPNIQLHTLDIANFDQIDRLASSLSGTPIDVLLSNAGIYPGGRSLGDTDYEAFAQAFHVNTIAALKLAESFMDHVAASTQKKMAFITSKMGSLGDNTSGGSYIYRSSKAALNAVVKSLAIDLAGQGIAVGLLHPGWVLTDMGGPNALITPEQSITGLRQRIEQLTVENAGTFYAYDGKVVPW